MAIGNFVMALGVNHSAERIPVVPEFNGGFHGIHIPPVIIRRNNGLSDRMNKSCIPLRYKSRAAGTSIFRQPGILLHVLGDADLPRLYADRLVVDPLHQAPALRDVPGGIVVRARNITNPTGSIPAKPVTKSLLQPANSAVAEILANLASAVIGPVITPRRGFSPIVIEINSAAVPAPPVELPEIAVIGADVVENDIKNNGNPALVGFIHQTSESVWTAVEILDREHVPLVVAPGIIKRKFAGRHDLDCIDAEIAQVIQL